MEWALGDTRVMEGRIRADLLRRLIYVQGHLEGVQRMVERDEPCARLLAQTYAVRRAIQAFELIVLEEFLRRSLHDAELPESLHELFGRGRRRGYASIRKPGELHGGTRTAGSAERAG